ncbi:tRNA (N6-isopentenyl adenosine(37)-C2)-methylthiotransferase MiaB [Candidatus Galacturonibacter soehngenii]|uniref:tRNA-2-methylthio-N(6)-dimethylallyladenosine synthase n=1 Tax=Candidatus Galacturonatibacter soehngenii TaxID=2307010 RepID=A0A7V7UCQ0_9FIRM|nr:tRNA (N6-isopentenyl adenosine(37)-C2)-methylthiotransferase MiaB [Candidatus Galacturonibacter soehngenii]KAB1439592.1 tRNA (N6-isopentenyl adenosine(37)-C2)-methylthiotransferase MiaB [Candidatus Galacturonibacter soehngenii]MBA4687111.1 tRNA (N6-isopentenyl adenosine(37)-C2)-methylthiotransferase MiaB [Candidatus Galacturonibacter soehngenii]
MDKKVIKIDFDTIDISKEEPITEPERQYYFIAKARALVKKKADELGRTLTCKVTTFGCQMNQKDSEKLLGILELVGYEQAETEKADFVIYNTCTVRDNANQKVYGRLGYLNGVKRENPNMLIALCGCMMQESEVVEKIKKSYSFVDIIFGTHNIFKFAELLYTRLQSERMVIDIWKGTNDIVEDLPTERKYSFKAGVNIMFGCNNFCSYCIVPYVRGRERSRNPKDIIREIEDLASQGVVEVMLLGQNVNSYGKSLEDPMTFAQLLQEIEKVDGIERIRFMTSHPKDLSDELIEVMKHSKKICKHMHLPLQSGSTRILEKMNRSYTKESYLELAQKIRKAIPDISITTDIIVGFPGETDEDVEETIDVVKKVRYDSAFTFIYSKRSGTPAAVMEGQVPEEINKERFDRLLSVVQQISREMTQRFSDQEVEVLVEEENQQDASLVTGRMSNNIIVHFKADKSLIGKIVKVKLLECKGFYYMAELI